MASSTRVLWSQPIKTLEFKGKILRGTFFGINENGSLNILVKKRVVEINVGDVFIL